MARLPKLVLACLAVVLLLPTVAHADQTDEARRLLDQANALIDQASALDSQAKVLMTQAGQLDVTSKNAAEALPLLDQAKAKMEEILAKLESQAALIDKAAALDVSPDLKTYLGLRKEIAELDLETYAVTGDLVARLQTAFGQWPQLSKSERAGLRAEVVDLDTQLQTLMTESSDKETASAQYYADKQLGEVLAGSGGGGFDSSFIWTLVLLAGVASGSYFLGQWYRRHKRRRAVQGS